MTKNRPVLMIGLDAAEVSLIEQLCTKGKLPTLQSLRQEGCFGVLESVAGQFAGGVWPTFYTGKDVPWHGIYHDKLWRPEHMRCEVVNDRWLPEKPFWELLDEQAYRTCLVDVPMILGLPKLRNGLQLSGWGTHDLIATGSSPPTLWRDLEKEFDKPSMPPEYFGPQTLQTLLHLRDSLLRSTDQITRISESLLCQGPWDLFLVVFGATHRGGHYLWDLSQIDQSRLSRPDRQTLENALVEIYQACDQAVHRLIRKAPKETKVIVFAVHGMRRNPGWADLCPEILAHIQQGAENSPAKTGLLYKMKRRLPMRFVRQITTRLPKWVQDRIVSTWSSGMFDWATTRYFPTPMDHAGYIRVNLRDREPQGIVEPGAEYDALCEELARVFSSFRDIDTGKAIVDKVIRLDALAPLDAPYRVLVPDLVVCWGDVSAAESRGIKSDELGELWFENPGKLPSGRTGNHGDKGWFIAAGKDIKPCSRAEDHHIMDIVPTIFRWLDAKPDETFQGEPIATLTT
jgi:predicted AlkP superfamily phosphohydrolase/phosphomutase